MNTDTLKARWKEAKGQLKQQWGKLTDDDLKVISGDIDKLSAKLQEYYSYTKDEAMAKAKEFKDSYEKNQESNYSSNANETNNIKNPEDQNNPNVVEMAGQAARKVGDFSKDVYEETKDATVHLKNEVDEYGQVLIDFIEKKPYQSLAIAALSGLVLGFIFRRIN